MENREYCGLCILCIFKDYMEYWEYCSLCMFCIFPGYMKYREYCGLEVVDSFSELHGISRQAQANLALIYKWVLKPTSTTTINI